MRKVSVFVCVTLLTLTGCATFESVSKDDPHVKSHKIEVVIDRSDFLITEPISVKHINYNGILYLDVSGSILSSSRGKFSRANVTAQFLDNKGEKISTKNKTIVLLRRRFTQLSNNQSIDIYAKDYPEIAKCKLSIEWVPRGFRSIN